MFKRWLQRDAKDLPAHERAHLEEVLSKSKVLATIYSMRQELSRAVGPLDRFERAAAAPARRLVPSRRERSRHRAAARQFSQTLRRYACSAGRDEGRANS